MSFSKAMASMSKKRLQMGRLTLKRTSKFSGSKSGGSYLNRLSWKGNSLFHLPRLFETENRCIPAGNKKAPQLRGFFQGSSTWT